MSSFLKIVLWLSLFLSLPLLAEVGSDLTYGGLYQFDGGIRSYHYAFIGGQNFSAGAIGEYSKPSRQVQDISYGGGMRFGNDLRFELGGGVFTREFRGLNQDGESEKRVGTGFFGSLAIAKPLSKHFRVSVPIIFKKITNKEDEKHLPKRWIVEFSPFIGICWL